MLEEFAVEDIYVYVSNSSVYFDALTFIPESGT
jgi:hypothetical protein